MPPKGSTLHPARPPPDAPPTAALLQMKDYLAGISDFELPKTTLTKLAKGSIPDNVKMQQDVVLALLRGSTLFISYLTSAAHDQATARSGKTVTAADVIKAITEMDFGPADVLVPIMEQELAAYRSIQAKVKANKKPPGPGRGRGPRKSKNRPAEAGEGEEDDREGIEGADEDTETGEGDGDGEIEEEEEKAEDT
ncbi:uncharacterized protein L203_104359 [Cryptococcus depauperatus CBS 7841]|uniref:DNA polymerase epsilon subunit D n=1 Tax=Cryptococcus depauperatus CBS 7841 TaxID=1295531 RepID=A0AAJ8M2G8_9TREE